MPLHEQERLSIGNGCTDCTRPYCALGGKTNRTHYRYFRRSIRSDCMAGLFYNPERVAAAMDAQGVEALIATTAPNIQYLTRYRRGGTVALLRRSDLAHPTLIVGSGSLAYCLEDPSDAVEVRPHGIFYRSFAEGVEWNAGEAFIKKHHEASRPEATSWSVLAEALTEAGLQGATIATDGTVDSLAALARLLPN